MMDGPLEGANDGPKEPREGGVDAPDDVGPPEPTSDRWLGTVGKTMIAVGLGGITFFAVVGGGMVSTRGAPASARLELERRRAEIDRAIAEADRARADAEEERPEGGGSRE
ncbi:MAG: hypothetical protein ACYTKD_00655 [Planctomycetota bacterium]|jgi:hypothetical protein